MYCNKDLCLALGMQLDTPIEKQPEFLKNAGFTAYAFDKLRHSDSKLSESIIRAGDNLGLRCEYIHAPFYGMDDIWHDESGDLADIMIKDLYATIDECKAFGVKYAVIHAIIGMDNHNPTSLGLERLEAVVDYAVSKNVFLAFENTEGEEYLEAIMNHFADVGKVGFCFDSGHEMCYNYSRNILGKYADRLFVTHLNDNMGMTGDELTFYDDSHLLPFDGVGDWQNIAQRIADSGFNGTLSFEVISKGRPERDTHGKYRNLTDQEYVNEAYKKAIQFRNMLG